MHALKLLHRIISKSSSIHQTRLDRLLICAESLTRGSDLTLTSIGEFSKGSAAVKHKIKAVDRLLKNPNIQNDKKEIYKAITHLFISSRPNPEIFVDWSTCNTRDHQVLRASVLFDGRSITIYEEVYHEKDHNKASSHKIFLNNLSRIVPENSKPIIITDAGFRTDWFKMVLMLGWDFIGRIRNRIVYFDPKHNQWLRCQDIEIKKQNTPKYIGNVKLTYRTKLNVNLFSYKGKSKGRTTNKGGKDIQAPFKKSNKESWILATSLEESRLLGKRVVFLYSKRMQIEETFKDLKDPETGIGLTLSRTKSLERISVLILIARLAEFLLMIIGVAAERLSLQYKYQTNSIKNKRVLSFQFLAKRIIQNGIKRITRASLRDAVNYISNYSGWSLYV